MFPCLMRTTWTYRPPGRVAKAQVWNRCLNSWIEDGMKFGLVSKYILAKLSAHRPSKRPVLPLNVLHFIVLFSVMFVYFDLPI